MRFIKVFFSIVLSIIFTIILTGGIFVYSINSFLSKENLKTVVNEIGIKEFVETEIEKNLGMDEGYLKIPEVKELIDNLIDQAIDYIVNNKDIPVITDTDIDKIVNSNYYENELGIHLSENEKIQYSNDLKEIFKSASESIESDLINIKAELFENNIMKIILSNNFIPAVIILLIVSAILIGICRWSWYRSLSWIGISMIIAGGLTIVLNSIISPMLAKETVDFLTNNIMDLLIERWLNSAFVIIFIGFIFWINYFILKSTLGKKKEDKLLDNL